MDFQYLLVIVVLIVMGWFAAGVLINLRRGDAMLKWMQNGLPRIGEKTTLRWLGSSIAELVIAKARSPFRRFETLVVLAPRDVPWFWLIAMINGRRDTLIFRAQLSVNPRFDFDLVDPTSWSGKMALKQAAQRGWERQPFQDLELVAPKGMHSLAMNLLTAVHSPVDQVSPRYWRFSMRKDTPNLELHIPFPDVKVIQASQYFQSLSSLGQALGDVHNLQAG